MTSIQSHCDKSQGCSLSGIDVQWRGSDKGKSLKPNNHN
nr:MAG TPA: hypothetical protein [Caudoviricetes sp.]